MRRNDRRNYLVGGGECAGKTSTRCTPNSHARVAISRTAGAGNPLSAFGGIAKLFSTHPPTEERIARLRAMAERA